MNENNFKKRLEFQQKIISRQSKENEELKLENKKLKLEIQEKQNIINSVAILRKELEQNVQEVKENKKEYVKLINELKKMKGIMNQTVYKGRWWLIRLFMK